MIRKLRLPWPLLVASVLLAALVAGCGGSGSSTGGEGSTETSQTSESDPTTSSGGDAEAWVQTALEYTGGPGGAADSSKTPVKIGYVNTEGGAELSFPGEGLGFNAAVDFINEELGGIDGHPLEVVQCLVASTNEQTQNCAQQMANDKSLVAVNTGKIAFGSPIFYSTIAGALPVVTQWPGPDLASVNAKNNYAISSGLFSAQSGLAYAAAESAGAQTVSVMTDTSGTSQQNAKELLEALKELGVEATLGSFAPNEADLTSAAVASKAQDTEATILSATSPDSCTAGMKALKGLGFDKPLIVTGACAGLTEELSQFPEVYQAAIYQNREVSNPQTEASNEILARAGTGDPEEGTSGGFSQGIGGAMITARLLNEVAGNGEVTAAGFEKAIKAFTGPSWLGPEPLKWGSVEGMPNLGARVVRIYKFQGGSWQDEEGGKWIDVAGGSSK